MHWYDFFRATFSLKFGKGGHLMGDALVFTTAEIVLGEATDLSFGRAHCEHSGWPELVVSTQ